MPRFNSTTPTAYQQTAIKTRSSVQKTSTDVISSPPPKKIRLKNDHHHDESEMINETASVRSFLQQQIFSDRELLLENSMNNHSSNDDSSASPQLPRSGRSSGMDQHNFDDDQIRSGIGLTYDLEEEEDDAADALMDGEELTFDGAQSGEVDGQTAANGQNYFACLHCNKYFWTETSLKHHNSLYHSEKSFVCEICGKAFRFRSNLAEHRSVHTSLKPYVCKFCGKSR
jgi:hypothetical protein